MNVTFCKTKAGNGFKIAVDDMWLYVSKRYLYRVLYNNAKSCHFRAIEEVSLFLRSEAEHVEVALNKGG